MHGQQNIKTLNICYKNQSVNAAKGNNRCLFKDPYNTHEYTPCAQNVEFLNVKPDGA